MAFEVMNHRATLFPPNVCALCDTRPEPSKQRVIDTGFNQVIPLTDVPGRKYVCEKCGLEIANRLGFVSNEQAKAALAAAESAKKQLAEVKDEVVTLASRIAEFAGAALAHTDSWKLNKVVESDFVKPKKPASKAKSAVADGADAPSGDSADSSAG